MTGAYLRVKRNGKWENIEIEYLTNRERADKFGHDNNIIQWLNLVCNKLAEIEPIINELVEVGIVGIK